MSILLLAVSGMTVQLTAVELPPASHEAATPNCVYTLSRAAEMAARVALSIVYAAALSSM
jgi:hypothetical protein